MKFRHSSGIIDNFSPMYAQLGALILGPFYFLAKGIWVHFLASLLLALVTGGWSWLLYWMIAPDAVKRHYFLTGWTEVK